MSSHTESRMSLADEAEEKEKDSLGNTPLLRSGIVIRQLAALCVSFLVLGIVGAVYSTGGSRYLFEYGKLCGEQRECQLSNRLLYVSAPVDIYIELVAHQPEQLPHGVQLAGHQPLPRDEGGRRLHGLRGLPHQRAAQQDHRGLRQAPGPLRPRPALRRLGLLLLRGPGADIRRENRHYHAALPDEHQPDQHRPQPPVGRRLAALLPQLDVPQPLLQQPHLLRHGQRAAARGLQPDHRERTVRAGAAVAGRVGAAPQPAVHPAGRGGEPGGDGGLLRGGNSELRGGSAGAVPEFPQTEPSDAHSGQLIKIFHRLPTKSMNSFFVLAPDSTASVTNMLNRSSPTLLPSSSSSARRHSAISCAWITGFLRDSYIRLCTCGSSTRGLASTMGRQQVFFFLQQADEKGQQQWASSGCTQQGSPQSYYSGWKYWIVLRDMDRNQLCKSFNIVLLMEFIIKGKRLIQNAALQLFQLGLFQVLDQHPQLLLPLRLAVLLQGLGPCALGCHPGRKPASARGLSGPGTGWRDSLVNLIDALGKFEVEGRAVADREGFPQFNNAQRLYGLHVPKLVLKHNLMEERIQKLAVELGKLGPNKAKVNAALKGAFSKFMEEKQEEVVLSDLPTHLAQSQTPVALVVPSVRLLHNFERLTRMTRDEDCEEVDGVSSQKQKRNEEEENRRATFTQHNYLATEANRVPYLVGRDSARPVVRYNLLEAKAEDAIRPLQSTLLQHELRQTGKDKPPMTLKERLVGMKASRVSEKIL